eukprot:Em0016g1046a
MTDEPIDLSVEALTGTVYDLCVSPFETILGIKMKIQRLEGIPVYQQQLVYKDTELQDEFCLEEYGICSGAQLKLLIAMRGGPVHAHRIPLEDPTLLEIAELLEAGRSSSRSPEHRLTVMFVRDGDDVGIVQVYPEDIESTSTISTMGPVPCEPPTTKTLQENSTTRNKMKELQARIRRRHEPHPGSVTKPRRAQLLVLEGRVASRLLSSRGCTTPTALTSDEQGRFPFHSERQVPSAHRSRAQACGGVRGEEADEDGEEEDGCDKVEARRQGPVRSCRVKDLAGHLSELLLQDPSPNNWLPRLPTGHTLNDTKKRSSQCVPLPAVATSSLVTQTSICHKQRNRCAHCGKKTRLAAAYNCRCGGVYCAVHRYPEVHACTYDYKAEGRQTLSKNNPKVVASKIHKI